MNFVKIVYVIFRIIFVVDFLFVNYFMCGGGIMFYKE